MMTDWYKEGYFWRKKGPEWEEQIYGYPISGKGDLIFNTCAKIIDDRDTSDWAKLAELLCWECLYNGKRWPDDMNHYFDAVNWFQWRWSQLLYKLKIRKTVMYRPQNNMTRDPFIAWMTLSVIFDEIIVMKIPWYLFRPSIWIWRRYLITGRGLWWYRFLTIRKPRKDYVKRLRGYMDLAITIKQ